MNLCPADLTNILTFANEGRDFIFVAKIS